MSGFIFFLLGIYSVTQTAYGQCCPDGWVIFQGSCYYVGYELSLTFIEAAHYCQQHHANLITIESSLENSFVKDLLRKTRVDYVWIGLTDMDIEGVWCWYSNDQIAHYTDWYPNEPDSNSGNEDCAVFHASSYKWRDYLCSRTYHPLCEMSIDTEPSVVG
ncbi:C-type lectin (CTL) or carbohydrate-recognition domain (CRD) [Mactra antiquata]